VISLIAIKKGFPPGVLPDAAPRASAYAWPRDRTGAEKADLLFDFFTWLYFGDCEI
jgi:hypothetical protein